MATRVWRSGRVLSRAVVAVVGCVAFVAAVVPAAAEEGPSSAHKETAPITCDDLTVSGRLGETKWAMIEVPPAPNSIPQGQDPEQWYWGLVASASWDASYHEISGGSPGSMGNIQVHAVDTTTQVSADLGRYIAGTNQSEDISGGDLFSGDLPAAKNRSTEKSHFVLLRFHAWEGYDQGEFSKLDWKITVEPVNSSV